MREMSNAGCVQFYFLVTFTAHLSFAYSPYCAQMLRTLAILLSLVCLHAQNSPHRNLVHTTERSETDYVKGGKEVESAPLINRNKNSLPEINECLETNAMTDQLIQTKLAELNQVLENRDPGPMEIRHTVEDYNTKLKEEIEACAKEHGSQKMELCTKAGKFVRTHMVDILEKLPSLSTMQANSPPKGDFYFAFIATVMFHYTFDVLYLENDFSSAFTPSKVFLCAINGITSTLMYHTDYRSLWRDISSPVGANDNSRAGSKAPKIDNKKTKKHTPDGFSQAR
ncbi:unnamed protein product [Albugo candida]|uniref:Uncharacterized protein n=1 Tax=Albugo candida TaxID=65357 RepID=A0A024GMM5_9STRA|nr:unnamed protein product [Albugo candida]|eukprot:CCI47954.1 unnamed protein product [Albugo candida]